MSSGRSMLNIFGDHQGSQCEQSSVTRGGVEGNEVREGQEADHADS